MAERKNGIVVTTTSSGTSDFAIDAAVAPWMDFSSVTDGAEVRYTAKTLTQVEFGRGTWDADTDTLARDTVYDGTDGPGVKVNFTESPMVFVGVLAEDLDEIYAPVPITAFGAVGDGTTDNTTALQAAFNSGAPYLAVPHGIFAFDGQLTIPSAVKRIDGSGTLRDVGDGHDESIVIDDHPGLTLEDFSAGRVGGDDALFLVTGATTVTFRHMTMVADGGPVIHTPDPTGFTGWLTIDWNTISGHADGRLILIKEGELANITNNSIIGELGVCGGVLSLFTTRAFIKNNFIQYASEFGTYTSSDSVVHDNIILDTRLEAISYTGSNIMVEGNYCRWDDGSSEDFGISCDDTGFPKSNNILRNNVIVNAGKAGIVLGGPAEDNLIQGNYILDSNQLSTEPQPGGITLAFNTDAAPWRASVIGNTIINNNGKMSVGIRVDEASFDTVLVSNVILGATVGWYDLAEPSVSVIDSTVPKVTVFTSSGTWTPDPQNVSSMLYCVGGGGGGGSCVGVVSHMHAAGGGGAGGYSVAHTQTKTPQTVTIGSAGSGGAAGTNNGGSGGATSIGALCVANGGGGGVFTDWSSGFGDAGAGATAGTGSVIAAPGANGGRGGRVENNTVFGINVGGSTIVGRGGTGGENSSGGNAVGFGAGGGGGTQFNSATNRAGGNGAAGRAWVVEAVIP